MIIKHLVKVSVADFKLIFRDPSLRAFLIFPFILFGLVVWFVPGLIERYEVLEPYASVILILAAVENTQVFGFISSMVLIDEKETGVARAYGVIPMSGGFFLFSRLLIPFLITVLLNVILFAAQPFYTIATWSNIVLSLLTALIVPVYVLGVNSLVKSRIEGLIYIKAFNIIVLLPFAAFFVPEAYKHLFGILPSHWVFQSIQRMTESQSFLPTAVIGVGFLSVLLVWVAKRFLNRHFV